MKIFELLFKRKIIKCNIMSRNNYLNVIDDKNNKINKSKNYIDNFSNNQNPFIDQYKNRSNYADSSNNYLYNDTQKETINNQQIKSQNTPFNVINTNISYVHIDSSQRIKQSLNNYDDQLYSLPPYALYFTHGSSLITIDLSINHNFKENDNIALSNVVSKNVVLKNILMVKKIVSL